MVKLRNEVRAMKIARELTYSQLLMPENTPQITGGGVITNESADRWDVLGRWRIRFERTDGIKETPFVDFAYDLHFSPTYAEFQDRIWGSTTTGDDLDYPEGYVYTGYEAAAGDNYVDFYIDATTEIVMLFSPFESMSVNFTVQAISSVPGRLTVERLI